MSFASLLNELDERIIAQRVGVQHDTARMRYSLNSNTIRNFEDFNRVISEYYNYHFTRCVSQGGSLSSTEASSRAKELLEQEYRRKGGDIVSAYNDAHDGTNGGMRAVLDAIAEGLKLYSVEGYIRDVFDRYIAPNSWETKVEYIRQFIAQCGVHLGFSIRPDQPERYAQNYKELIRSYVNALQRTSSVFRRL
ncbi:MAG: hypothetical protein C4582_00650 [Desulfobacteraceae bacterium]|jgi:hypothetical protein|nr:MAG: hypothetical protein C4582_00650 [Desulfobacteraceae bacterium]